MHRAGPHADHGTPLGIGGALRGAGGVGGGAVAGMGRLCAQQVVARPLSPRAGGAVHGGAQARRQAVHAGPVQRFQGKVKEKICYSFCCGGGFSAIISCILTYLFRKVI